MDSMKIRVSALIGSLFCIVADLSQKTEASAMRNLGSTVGEFVGLDFSQGKLLALVLVVLGALSLSFIFEPETKRKAFYLGASVLAIMMTIVPYDRANDFKTTPNSEKVTVTLSTEDGQKVSGIEMTLWNSKRNEIIARTRINHSKYTFYQDAGNYKLSLYMPGYKREIREITVKGFYTRRTVKSDYVIIHIRQV